MRSYYMMYRKYNLDIWGILKTTFCLQQFEKFDSKPFDFKISKKVNWVNQYFYNKFNVPRPNYLARFSRYVYRIDMISYKKKSKKVLKTLLSFYAIKLFYLILSFKHLLKICKKASKQRGSFELNYLWLLEGSMVSLIYSLNFLPNMFDSMHFVNLGLVCMNYDFIFQLNHLVPLMIFIKFKWFMKGFMFWTLIRRIKRKAVLSCRPSFIYLSDCFLSFFLKSLPYAKDMINPFGLDVFSVTGFND